MTHNKRKEPKKETPQIVVHNISVKPPVRRTMDVGSWRQALISADRGRVIQLYDMYEDLLLDPVLGDAIGKRKEAITNAELTYTDKSGEPVAEMDSLIDSPIFEELLNDLMDAIFYGITVEELSFGPEGMQVYCVPRKHIRRDYKEIAKWQTDERGMSYDQEGFIEAIGEERYGLILKAAPYVIYRRGNYGDWAQYAEIFGHPFRKATYNMNDEQGRRQLEQALEACGAGMTAIIPDGTNIEVTKMAESGDGSLYKLLDTACKEEILIAILGQTMTTIDGSSRAQAEVHLEVQEGKHKADRRYIQRILNHKLLPLLVSRGVVSPGGFFYFPESGENISLKDRVEIDVQLTNVIDISADYFYETYGIPKPADGDELARGRTSQVEVPKEFHSESPPLGEEESNLIKRLLDFFVGAPVQGAYSGNPRINLNDAKESEDDDFDTKLIKRVARGEATYFDPELFWLFSEQLREALSKGYNSKKRVRLSEGGIGVDYDVVHSAVITAMETNVFHFSAAKTIAELQQLNQIYREAKSFQEFLREAKKVTDVFNHAWAQTEYNTAGLIAEGVATYNRLREQTDLFPFWEYKTIGDDKVRPEHAALHGVVLEEDDSRWKKIYPPNGWNCRCYVVPRMKHEGEGVDIDAMRARVDEYFKTKEWTVVKSNGFGINRADSSEVFKATDMYIKKFPNQAARYLNQLNAAKWGFKEAAYYQGKASEKIAFYKGDATDWWKLYQKDGEIQLPDRKKRTLVISKKSYIDHTTGKKSGRVQYLDAMRATVSDPDEVWLNGEKADSRIYDNYTLIKYYSDEVVMVCCRVEKGNTFAIKTWLPMHLNKRVDRLRRRGLLIYKKTST